jgi:hypothetical protein
MQNVEKIADKCARLNAALETRYTAFMKKLDDNTGKSRKALTEDNIVQSLDILDTYRHDYERDLRIEQKFLQATEAMYKKTYKLVKRYYGKRYPTEDGLSKFVQAHPEYGFDEHDEDLQEMIVGKEVEDYIQANDDYIAVTQTHGNQLSFYNLIDAELDGLKQRAFTLQQAAKSLRHDQGNFG